ncbi:unnamed protein product [Brassica rapa subsp. trilocularis]
MVMHNYSKYFNGSVPLSSILPTGLGAVAVRGVPSVNEATRSFLYPTNAEIEPFTSSRFNPRRLIPLAMSVTFQHCEYEGLDEEAERYAIVAHTNLRWPLENGDQNEWTLVNSCVTHRGDVWSFMCHRFSNPVVSLHFQLGEKRNKNKKNDGDIPLVAHLLSSFCYSTKKIYEKGSRD